AWFLQLIGFDADRIPADAELKLVWTNVPSSWRVFLLIGVVAFVMYLVLFLYRREINTCPIWWKRVLAGIRLSALAVLMLIFLGPAVAPIQQQTSYPNVALVRDASQSMNTEDRYLDDKSAEVVANATASSVSTIRSRRPSRTSLLEEVFEQEERLFIKQLEQLGKLRLIDFGNDVIDVETRPIRKKAVGTTEQSSSAAESLQSSTPVVALPKSDATQRGTDLYQAIAQTINDERTSAAVFFTDGQHTSSEYGPDQLLAVAKNAGNEGIPLLFVGLGDPEPPRNLQISEVYADPQVWRGDPFEIQVVLKAFGVDSQTAIVTLIERRVLENGELSSAETELQRREVSIPDGGGQQRLIFSHNAANEGRFSYTARVTPIENELSEADNQPESPAEVKVLGEQARVLLVAGSPSWEFRGLQRVLTREKSVDLSCWLQTMDVKRQQDGNTAIDRLPVTRKALFEYDVIILADPNPIEFDAAWLDLLKQFIGEHAGGFLYMAGPKYSGRFLAAQKTRELRDLLPVRFGDVRAVEVETLLSSNARAWDLGVVTSNVDQPIMRFFPEPTRSLDQWKELSGIYWSFPAQQAKPASRVLIEHTDPTLRGAEGARPLLATGQYGSGRSVYIGFNGTWRWRRAGNNSEYYKRFWIQMVRYLVAGRTLEGKRRGTIEADRFRYQLGDRVNLRARLKDASYKPLAERQVTATIQVAGKEPVPFTLKPIPNQPGHYQSTLTATSTGQHVVRVDLADEMISDEAPRVEVSFSVSTPTVESNSVWLNKPLLTTLGQASGGGYFELDELEQVIASIPDASRTIDVQGTPIPLWDTSRLLLLLVGLLCFEWAVRKQFKLM
ncbi:MAG: hypothetical protein AAF802_29320, partial [Planctomycetota bacterium]